MRYLRRQDDDCWKPICERRSSDVFQELKMVCINPKCDDFTGLGLTM